MTVMLYCKFKIAIGQSVEALSEMCCFCEKSKNVNNQDSVAT